MQPFKHTPSSNPVPLGLIGVRPGYDAGNPMRVVLPPIGHRPTMSIAPADAAGDLRLPPLKLPPRMASDIEVYQTTIQRFHANAEAGIKPTEVDYRQLCTAVQTYLQSPEGQSAPATWGSAVHQANLLIDRWSAAGMRFEPLESPAVLETHQTASNPHPMGCPHAILTEQPPPVQQVPHAVPGPAAVPWSQEAQAMRDLMRAWTALAQSGVPLVSELAMLGAFLNVTKSERFSEAERTGLNVLAGQLISLCSAGRKPDTNAQNQGSEKTVATKPPAKRAADTGATQEPAKVRRTGTAMSPGETTFVKEFKAYKAMSRQWVILDLQDLSSFSQMADKVQKLRGTEPQSVVRLAFTLAEKRSMVPDGITPTFRLVALLFLFGGVDPKDQPLTEFVELLPGSWPDALDDGLRRTLLDIWRNDHSDLGPLIRTRYGAPSQPAQQRQSTGSHTVAPVSIDLTSEVRQPSPPVVLIPPTVPQAGPEQEAAATPKMRTELTKEYGKLQKLLGVEMFVADPEQIGTLRRQFQEAATLALRDGNMAAYRHIEQLVSNWFREQYEAARSVLPPSRLADPFSLLDGASGTLIELMHKNDVGLARDTPRAEGGEVLQPPPPTPRDDGN